MKLFAIVACLGLALVSGTEQQSLPPPRLIRTLWGVSQFEDVREWPALFAELKAANYSGVEAPTWVVCGVGPTFDIVHACDDDRANAFRNALASSGLFYIAQVHTAGYPIASGDVSAHVTSLRQVAQLAITKLGARLANVHGGCDWWEPLQMVDFFAAVHEVETALQIELEQQSQLASPLNPPSVGDHESPKLGSPFLTHETHRMRALSTPRAAQIVLEAFPATPLTADLSHWVVGAERTFDFPSDDAWWPPLLQQVANATVLTHARVGAPREIQVGDPSAPEHASLLATYEQWWALLWANQQARNVPVLIEAEYGPSPYMPSLPHTEMPVSDLAHAVEFVGRRQVSRFKDGVCKAP